MDFSSRRIDVLLLKWHGVPVQQLQLKRWLLRWMGREMDAAISCCDIRRNAGSVEIVAGNLRIVISAEEPGQTLQSETLVAPRSGVTRGDELAVNGAAARSAESS